MNNKGFISITAVITLSAISLTIVVGVYARTITDTQIALAMSDHIHTTYLADSCAEHALWQLIQNLEYAGDEIRTVNGEDCYVLPIDGTGNENITVSVHATSSNFVSKSKLEIAEISPVLNVSSWQTISDF